MILRPILQPILRPVLGAIGNRRPTALTISQLLPAGAGRVAAIYSDPARPSYDECIQKNMAAIAAGRPQDCVLFADAAGQTPVVYPIGAGQGKGLLLDRSAGLVRGVELAVNGGFDTDTDWTKGAGWAIGSGVATKTAGTASTLTPSAALTPTVSKVYEVVYTITRTAGSATVSIGAVAGAAKTASGTYTEKLLATTADNLTISADAAFAGTIDNISVREIPGHHQQQPTAAARGEFSRRYNQLLATEDFGNAVWVKNFGDEVVVANQTAAPDGTLTADLFSVTTPTSRRISQSQPIGLGSHKFSVWARAVSGSVTGFVVTVSAGGGGVFSNVVTDVSVLTETWTLVTCSFDVTTAGTISTRIYFSVDNSSAYIWGADLRPTADAIPSLPAYQRVTTASDYDEVGFPTYWRAVTDDWAKSHMNPNGATKSYVFWAGQKMSEAATGMIFETSPIFESTPGTVGLLAPAASGTAEILYRSQGTAAATASFTGVTAYDTPNRLIAVGQSDITNKVCSLTVNGTTTTSAADQGTGTYTEQDVFFASRAGTSLFANIREYAPPTILFLQPTDSLSASHLSKLQRGYAKAVGVTL